MPSRSALTEDTDVVAAARPLSTSIPESTHVGIDLRLRRAARVIVAVVSLFSVAVGSAGVVASSATHVGVGIELPPPAAAASFILTGVACWLLGTGETRRWRTLLTPAAQLMAAVVIAGAGIDLAGRRWRVGGGHIISWSALGFLLFGAALLGIDWTVTAHSRRYWPAHAFAFAGGMVSIAGLLDAVLAQNSPATGLPLSSSLALFGLALGIVCARPDYSLGALLTSTTLGGVLTRWLWPAAVILPVLLGMASQRATSAGLLPDEGTLPALLLSMITLIGALVVWNGQRVDQNDRVRQLIQDALSRRERELREAHRLARIGSWRWDIDQARLTWSPELYRITGHDPTQPPPGFEDFLGTQTPESSERFRAALADARSSGAPFELDVARARSRRRVSDPADALARCPSIGHAGPLGRGEHHAVAACRRGLLRLHQSPGSGARHHHRRRHGKRHSRPAARSGA